MGYSILYNWQFIRSKEGITPVILCGENNVTELRRTGAGRTIEVRARDWDCLFNMIGVPEEDIIKEAESLRDKNAQELWMRNGKWVDGAEFLRWATKAVKDAAPIEDILLINRPTYMYVEAYITVWPPRGDKGWSRNILRQTIRTTEELDAWILQARPALQNAKENRQTAYAIVRYSQEKFLKATKLPDEILLMSGNRYVEKLNTDEYGVTGISYGVARGKPRTALRLSREEYIKLMSLKWLSLLKGVRPVPAKGKDGPYNAVVRVSSSHLVRDGYLYSSGPKISIVQTTRGAKWFKNLADAERTAKSLNKKYGDKGYTFEAVCAE